MVMNNDLYYLWGPANKRGMRIDQKYCKIFMNNTEVILNINEMGWVKIFYWDLKNKRKSCIKNYKIKKILYYNFLTLFLFQNFWKFLLFIVFFLWVYEICNN